MREFFEFTDTVKAASKKALAKTEKMFSNMFRQNKSKELVYLLF